MPPGLCPESGTWSPTWLSNSRSAPDWQRFTNLCHTGGLRPGYGGPGLAPAGPPYTPVTVSFEGFSSPRHGEVAGGAPLDEVGSQVTCGRPTPPVWSRP